MPHPHSTLQKLGIQPRKRLSQNFLTSPHWVDKILQTALTEPSDEIWEIGPGLGALTRPLLERTKVPVRAFEYDRKLCAYLREEFSALIVEEGDVLKAPWESLLPNKKVSLVSNLPYHLSSPILYKLEAHRNSWVRLVLMFQKEFARRLRAQSATEDYGGLSVVAQTAFEIHSLGVLSPGSFFPPPDVDSEILWLKPKAKEDGLEKLSEVVRAAFQFRRKKVRTGLLLSFPQAHIDEYLDKIGAEPSSRAEELSVEQYHQLTRFLGKF